MTAVGSLFTGYGGLDKAVLEVFGGTVSYVSDIEPAANALLAAHHPDIPNIGDINDVNWAETPDVDLVVGGYPCQPFSLSGERRGTEDERHLWPNVLEAIKTKQPGRVVLENVRGHLSLGFDEVLSDLVGAGYEVWWSVVAAGSIGAPHRRERLYVYGTRTGEQGRTIDFSELLLTKRGTPKLPAAGHAGEKLEAHNRLDHAVQFAYPLLPTPVARDWKGTNSIAEHRRRTPNLSAITYYFPTPKASDGTLSGALTTGRPKDKSTHLGTITNLLPGVIGEETEVREWTPFNEEKWGKYARAVARWELVTGLEAPKPTMKGRTGNPQLSPEFAEWMMGLAPGTVTDPEVDIRRAKRIKLIGNGVVPQAAQFALQGLIERASNRKEMS